MLLNAYKSSSFASEWFSIESQMSYLLGNGSLHSFCICAWIKLDFSLVSSRTDKDIASHILFFKGTGTRTEGTFPFTRFNAHIQFCHNKVEFGKSKKEKQAKKNFFFVWLRWKCWRTETEKMPHGNIFEVYLDVVVSASASSLNHCSSREGPFSSSPPPLYQYINYVKHHWKYTLTQQLCNEKI